MNKMTTLVATIATSLLLAGLALIAPSPAVAATPTPGSDCACPTTGPYVAPKAPEDPVIEWDGSSAASNPKYRVAASGTWPDVTVQVRRLADNEVVLTVTGAPANWGFSPDQDRFVTHGIVNGTFVVQLYDLTAANPGNSLWSTSTLSSENRVAFSPHGKYLAFTWQNNVSTDTVQHQFVDTATGSEYDVQYSFYIPPAGGGTRFGEAGIGFSPDAGDHAFFTSYVTGQTTIQNALYDLRARDNTWSHQRIGTGFWRFSPCGDVLGVVEQDGQIADNVSLVKVSDGQQLAARSYPISYIALRTTAASHIVSVNNVDQPALAPNTAGAACADTTAPTWPSGATLAASNVAKTSLTLTWPAATDDKAVTQYKVYRGTTLLGTTGASTRTYNVTGLTQGTSYTFKVQAADAAGNTTTDGPSLTVRTAADAPAWPVGSSVVAGNVTEESATLRWSAASGTVASYKVYRDGVVVGTVPGSARSYPATGLSAGTSYLFKIEAVGSTGAESVNGPGVRVRTPGYEQLDTNELTGTVWWDDNSNGVREENEDGVDRTQTPDVGVYAYRMVDGTSALGPYAGALNTDGTYTIDNLADGEYVVSLIVAPRAQSFPGDYQPHRIAVVGGQGIAGVDFGMKSSGSFPEQGTGSGTITATVSRDGGGTVTDAGVHCYYVSLGSGCGLDPTAGEDGTLNLSGLTSGTYELLAKLGPHQWQTAPMLDGEPLKHVVVVGSNGGGGTAAFTVLQGESTITGEVYDDANGDGVRGADEGPLTAPESVAVCLEPVDAVLEEECTSTDGSYSFSNLLPGDYRLSVDDYGDWVQTEPAGAPLLVHVAANGDTVAAGQLGAHNPRGTVHGIVWEDRDADGVHDAGETGLPAIRVCVQRNGYEGWSCQVTDDEGRYATGKLQVSGYTVWIENGHNDAWTQTFPADGLGHEINVTDGGEHVADFGLNDGTVVEEDTAPGAPASLEAAAGVEKVSLTWSAPANDGGSPVTGYVVQKSFDGVVWTDVDTVEGTSLEVTGLTGGIPVPFRVAAVNAIGRGDWSEVVTATPESPIVAPSAPAGPTATAGVEKVSLAWAAPAEDGGAEVTGYVVQKSLDGVDWTDLDTVTGTSLEVTGLTGGTPVHFRVAAVNSAGRGAWSDEVTATPTAKPIPVVTVPSAPTGLTATVTGNRRTVTLAWQPPASDGGAPVTDYVVQASLFPYGPWITVKDGVSATPKVTMTTAMPGLKLYYRVAAKNSAGVGAWSGTVRAG